MRVRKKIQTRSKGYERKVRGAMRWEAFVAVRYLVAKRREGFISVISAMSITGIAVGVAALIVVIAVMSGFGNDLKSKIVGTNAHIVIESELGIDPSSRTQAEIESVPSVTAAAPYVSGQAMLVKGEEATGVLVRGIDPDQETAATSLGGYVRKGTLDLAEYGAVIGSELASRMGVLLNDEIVLISPARTKGRSFKVRGVFSSGMYVYDANIVYVGMDEAQELFGMQTLVSGFSVRVNDPLRVPEIQDTLRQVVGGYPLTVRSWMDLDRNLIAALRMEKIVMFIVVGLIILVACFNIASFLIMIVTEKTKDIGVLRSLGATVGSIRKIFFFEGVLIGVLGTGVGCGIGIFVARRIDAIARFVESTTGFSVFPSDIYYFDTIPSLVNGIDVLYIVLFSLATSFLAAIYPAHKAACLDPVEALRYE
ncbi:MAG: lipoprotein-releasing ABC transporter permease subunit [Candidatus Omnitrophota bacterium]